MELPPEAYEEFRQLLEDQGIFMSDDLLKQAADDWFRLYRVVEYPPEDSHD
jgi:hypothetical protein